MKKRRAVAYFGARKFCTENDSQRRVFDSCAFAIRTRPTTRHDDSANSETSERKVKSIAVIKPYHEFKRISSRECLGAIPGLCRVFPIFERYRTVIDVIFNFEVAVSLTRDDNGLRSKTDCPKNKNGLGAVQTTEPSFRCVVR
jgi:hypothetical protein